MVDPAAVNLADTVEVCDVIGGEKCGANVANEATDSVNRENIESVVNSEDELELSGVVGKRSSEYAKRYGSPDGNVSYDESVNYFSEEMIIASCTYQNPA